MTQDLSDKIYNLQKNFLELNNLFELNILSNQACSLDDLLSKISLFLTSNFNLNDVIFFVKKEQTFKSVTCSENFDTFEFDTEYADFLNYAGKELIPTVNPDGSPKYKSLWESASLERLNSAYIKVFFKDDDPFCVCSIGQKENNEPFEKEETDLLNKMFYCIEPLLVKFVRQAEQEIQITSLHKSLHNLSILYNISQAVNFIDDLKGLIQVILGRALETIEAEKGSLMLYDMTDNTLQVKVVYGLKDPKVEFDINNGVIECSKLKVNEGIAGKVFAEKKSIITNLGQNDPRFKQTNLLNNISSMICVPLIAKGEAIGVINITNKKIINF